MRPTISRPHPATALALLALSFGAAPARSAVAIDASVSEDQGAAASTVVSPSFSTLAGNELILAFITTDYLSGANTTVKSVSGAGLTWALVIRSNVESGTSEIWRAFAPNPLSTVFVSATLSQSVASSISVMTFTGADPSGVNGAGAIGAAAAKGAMTGAPSASLVTTRANSWVIGAGNDFDRAIARTPGTGQTIVHQFLSPAGDTYWVQMQNAPIAVQGTTVTINDTAPTTDRFNLAICEILPANVGVPTWSLSGSITPVPAGAGANVALSGPATESTTTNGSGLYTFTGLANGSYTVTPSKTGIGFTPPNQIVPISGANVSGINFTAAPDPTDSLAIDVATWTDAGSANATVVSPPFSTTAGNELLLAMIATDYISGANTTVKSVSGGGLTWQLVIRSNAQKGSSEIWRAFSPGVVSNVSVTATLSQSVISSIAVITFIGADQTGANGSGAIGAVTAASGASGPPTGTLVTTRNKSWVFGVGNDFDNAIARTVGPSQTLLHQYLTPDGDTYWMQMGSAPTPTLGTSVTINDTAPVSDRFNLSLCEILPALGNGGGGGSPPTISLAAPAPNATVSSLSTFWANASDPTGIASVQFLVDGTAIGSEIAYRPFSITWDSTTVSNGTHIVSAEAADVYGLTSTASASVNVNNSGSPSVVGSWSSVVQIPAVAVNLVLLKTNKILFYQDGTTATVWDYVNGIFTPVPTSTDLFCSGHAAMADGRILVVGGYGGADNEYGIWNAQIFDPVTNLWTAVPHMAYKRWYPNAITLPNGQVLVTAGWQTVEHSNAGIPEIYNPATNTWTQLTTANNPFESYPFISILPDGNIIHTGGSEYPTSTDILNLTSETWSTFDPNIVDGGSATMYLPGKILKAGSASDSQGVGQSASTAYTLDMTQASPAWQEVPSMSYIRSFLNLPVLPDGTILAIGGETDKNGGIIANAVYATELWSPQTQAWTTLSPMSVPREYHSTAVLLPDARVLVSGMGADFNNVPNETNAQFFSPPYLFKGARPTIVQAPANLGYGQSFTVTTPDFASITSVVMIRTGAVTHFFDQNTRFVPLSFTQTAGGLQVSAPPTANIAPPGYYMLFIVNSSGVPSIAPFVQMVQ